MKLYENERLIKAIADVLRARSAGTFVVRIGGEKDTLVPHVRMVLEAAEPYLQQYYVKG